MASSEREGATPSVVIDIVTFRLDGELRIRAGRAAVHGEDRCADDDDEALRQTVKPR